MKKIRQGLLMFICLLSLANCRRGGGMMGGGGPMEGAGPCRRCNPGPQNPENFERERLNAINETAPFPIETNTSPEVEGNPIQNGDIPVVNGLSEGLIGSNGAIVPPVSMQELGGAVEAPALPGEEPTDPSVDPATVETIIVPRDTSSQETPTHE